MRERYIIVLAATHTEAAQYAKRAGLHARNYRIALRRGQLAGIKVADAHVLPSFWKAPQRHSILQAFRWSKEVNLIDVEMPAKADAPPVDQGDGMGPQLTIDDVFHKGGEIPGAQEIQNGETAEPVSTPEQHSRLEVLQDLADDVDETEEEIADGSEAGEAEQGEDVAPAEEEAPKPRRRRQRCKDCGELKPLDDPHECATAAPVTKSADEFFA